LVGFHLVGCAARVLTAVDVDAGRLGGSVEGDCQPAVGVGAQC
jgi:hypothetical protein